MMYFTYYTHQKMSAMMRDADQWRLAQALKREQAALKSRTAATNPLHDVLAVLQTKFQKPAPNTSCVMPQTLVYEPCCPA